MLFFMRSRGGSFLVFDSVDNTLEAVSNQQLCEYFRKTGKLVTNIKRGGRSFMVLNHDELYDSVLVSSDRPELQFNFFTAFLMHVSGNSEIVRVADKLFFNDDKDFLPMELTLVKFSKRCSDYIYYDSGALALKAGQYTAPVRRTERGLVVDGVISLSDDPIDVGRALVRGGESMIAAFSDFITPEIKRCMLLNI